MSWPKNKDGALLERMERDGINFLKPHLLEFNVDFNCWPPPPDAVKKLQEKFSDLKLYHPGKLDDLQEGYISLTTYAKVSYEFVTDTQRDISEMMSQYGGYCNSWGIL